MPTPKRVEKTQKSGRMILAAQALRRGQISSVRAAASLFNVPRSTEARIMCLCTPLQGMLLGCLANKIANIIGCLCFKSCCLELPGQ